MISPEYIDDYDFTVNRTKYNPVNTNLIIKAYKDKLPFVEVVENNMKHKILFNTSQSVNPLVAIPTIIDINDNRPPHEVPLYRRMMQLYLGIIPKVIASGGHLRNETGQNIKSTDAITIIRTATQKKDTWDLCGKTVTITAVYKDLMYFPNSLNITCFTPGCGNNYTNNVHTFQIGTEIIVCFGVGSTDSNMIIVDMPIMFQKWLDQLLIILNTNRINRILLCGHSNGMSAATIVAFILLYIKDQQIIRLFPEIYEHNKELFNYLDSIRKKWTILKNIELFVVGTAGFPVLFSTQEQFNLFYEMMGGRYLHIVSSHLPYDNLQNLYDMCGFDRKFDRIDTNITIISGFVQFNDDPKTYLSDIYNKLIHISKIISLYPHKVHKGFISEYKEFKIPLDFFKSHIEKIKEPINNIFKEILKTEGQFDELKIDPKFTKYYRTYLSQYKSVLNQLKITFAAIIHYIAKIEDYIKYPKQYNIDGYTSQVFYNNFNNFKLAIYTSNNCFAEMVIGVIPIGNYIYKDEDSSLHQFSSYRDVIYSYFFADM